MNPSNSAKFGIAFAAGLVVALASVVTYVKTTGLHIVPGAAVAPVVEQNKQPENLNTVVKPEEPVVAPAPKSLTPPAPVLETPAPVQVAPPAPPNTVQPKAKPVPRHRASATQVARVHYLPRALPESDTSMRVEVSQIKPGAEQIPLAPPPGIVDQPVPAVLSGSTAPILAPVQPPQPHIVTLQPGTSLVVRVGETLSTDHNYSGDTFRATLDRPIILDGFVIADKGSKVLGKITGLDKAGKFEGTSNLQLALTEINTTDGQRVHVQTGFVNRKGAPNNGEGEAAKVGGGAVLGAIIGAIAGGGKGAAIGAGAGGAVGAGTVMLGKGRPAVVPTETLLTFQLSAPTTITEHFNN